MDQSASVISTPDSALYISFFPVLSAEPIALPITSPRSVFVCANSLVVSDKVVHSKTRYNLRAFETLVAARVLANKLGVEIGEEEKLTLREFLDRWLGVDKGKEIGVGELKQGIKNVMQHLGVLKLVQEDETKGETGVSLDEMIKLTGMDAETFDKVYLKWANSEHRHLLFSIWLLTVR